MYSPERSDQVSASKTFRQIKTKIFAQETKNHLNGFSGNYIFRQSKGKKEKKKVSFHAPMSSWLNTHCFSCGFSFQFLSFSAFKSERVYCYLSCLLLAEERGITRSFTKANWVHKSGKLWSKSVEPDSPSENRTWTNLYH